MFSMESRRSSDADILNSGTTSLVDAATETLRTLLRGCVRRDELRQRFAERFGGGYARAYFAHALRRLERSGEAVKSMLGGVEYICTAGHAAEIINRHRDLLEALVTDVQVLPRHVVNGRLMSRLARGGRLKALSRFICRLGNVTAYVSDAVDLLYTLAALNRVLVPFNAVEILKVYATSRGWMRLPDDPGCVCAGGNVEIYTTKEAVVSLLGAETVEDAEQRLVVVLPTGIAVDASFKTDCVYVWLPEVAGEASLELLLAFVRIVS